MYLQVMTHSFERVFVEGEFELRGKLVESLLDGFLHKILKRSGLYIVGCCFNNFDNAEQLILTIHDCEGRGVRMSEIKLVFDIDPNTPFFAVLGEGIGCGTYRFRVIPYYQPYVQNFCRFAFEFVFPPSSGVQDETVEPK